MQQCCTTSGAYSSALHYCMHSTPLCIALSALSALCTALWQSHARIVPSALALHMVANTCRQRCTSTTLPAQGTGRAGVQSGGWAQACITAQHCTALHCTAHCGCTLGLWHLTFCSPLHYFRFTDEYHGEDSGIADFNADVRERRRDAAANLLRFARLVETHCPEKCLTA